MLAFTEKLFSLLVSPYAYVAVRSWEESQVIETVRALAEQLRRPMTEWAPTADKTAAARAGLLATLAELAEADPGSIVVIADAHPYLSDHAVVRQLRALESKLASTQRVVVFVSPFLDVPPELIKDVTVLDAPLPGRIELETVLDQVYPIDRYPDLPRERIIAAALGLTLREARRAFTRARFEKQQATRRGVDDFDIEAAIIAEKRRQIEVDRVLEYCELDRRIDQIGGLDHLKRWLEERKEAFTPAASRFGLPAPRGLLLTGVQGCGKSLFAKAVAGFWGVPLLRLDIGRLFDGSMPPEAALRRAIQTAEALSPAVLWLDEIDKAFGDDSAGAERRLMGTLLGWLQDKEDPVFFVATANRVESLPPELLRKGRFDEIFFVDLPSQEARIDILSIHLARHGREPDSFDLKALAKHAEHFSGAELEQVVVSGLFKAFAQKRELAATDLEQAVQETVPLYRTYEADIKALREWAQGRARPAAADRTLLDLFDARKRGDT